eukprot:TRINITY_DN1834_c0_g1_i1.p1 TRINITY_DN1834_c0_g1~~TRINITY_DN1834_c0_g1_i1.p1  ORF type:complete len:105 (+),score=7.72 TRINITY_DN1834_c0_g1_i1:148-462(+)
MCQTLFLSAFNYVKNESRSVLQAHNLQQSWVIVQPTLLSCSCYYFPEAMVLLRSEHPAMHSYAIPCLWFLARRESWTIAIRGLRWIQPQRMSKSGHWGAEREVP